jgi:hypothetical protein
MYGNCFLETAYDKTTMWKFWYGHIYTKRPIQLFNNITVNISGDISWGHNQDLYFLNNSYIHSLILHAGAGVSGFFDTFQRGDYGHTEETSITYDVSAGHSHDAGYWSNPEGTSANLVSPIHYFSSYVYGLTASNIVRLSMVDTSSEPSVNNWKIFRNDVGNFDSSHRVSVYNTDFGVFGNGGSFAVIAGEKIDISGNVRGAMLKEKAIYYRLSDGVIATSDDEEYTTGISADDTTAMYLLGTSDVFFVLGGTNKLVHYDGLKIAVIESPTSPFTDSTFWKGEIILRTKDDDLYRFNGKEFIFLLSLKSLEWTVKTFCFVDNVMYVSFVDGDKQFVHGYVLEANVRRLSLHVLLTSNNVNDIFTAYYTVNNVYIQLGRNRRGISRGRSSALNFDALEGTLVLPSGNITCEDYIDAGDAIIVGKTDEAISPAGYATIHDDEYVLGSGSVYLDLIYNSEHSRTYTDITASIVHDNKYYYGHRGDISVFSKGPDGQLQEPESTEFANKIACRFMPAGEKLFALVQDFNETLINYTVETPPAPTGSFNHIPHLPMQWGRPRTRIYEKDTQSNSWSQHIPSETEYGRDIIDAITHDDMLYVLSRPASGEIACYRHDTETFTKTITGYSGALELNESLLYASQSTLSVYEFAISGNGAFEVDSNGDFVKWKMTDTSNGFHRHYLYNHPRGPYVVHDQVEILRSNIGSSGIYPLPTGYDSSPYSGYFVDYGGIEKYNVRTISVSFVDWKINPNIESPVAKLVLGKDSPTPVGGIEDDEYKMTDLRKTAKRDSIRFITSVTNNKAIFILTQEDKKVLNIYRISDFNEYLTKTPHPSGHLTVGSPTREKTTVSDGLSRVGIPRHEDPPDDADDYRFYYEFDGTANYSNMLYCSINISESLGLSEPIKVLGDGDDLFIPSPGFDVYTYHRRYSDIGAANINGNLYVPLLCRKNDPIGEMFGLVLIIYRDGVVRIAGKENTTHTIFRPVGRSHFLKDGTSFVTSSMKMQDDEKTMVSFEDIKEDEIADEIFMGINVTAQSLNERLQRIYNTFGHKQWLIGERKTTSSDIMNIKERY